MILFRRLENSFNCFNKILISLSGKQKLLKQTGTSQQQKMNCWKLNLNLLATTLLNRFRNTIFCCALDECSAHSSWADATLVKVQQFSFKTQYLSGLKFSASLTETTHVQLPAGTQEWLLQSARSLALAPLIFYLSTARLKCFTNM